MGNHSRRRFLQLTGATAGGLTVGVGSASANSGEEGRFFIDLTEVDESEVPEDVEIIHDVSQIDLLVARGDPGTVGGASATLPDIAVAQHGPVAERDKGGQPGFASEEPTNGDLQWDKRAQNVADIDEHPGKGGRYVHETTRGEGTSIAVIDSGVYDGHPDLADVVDEERSENFTTDADDWRPNGAGNHGTHVAGTVAATNEGVGDAGGVTGTAPETDIVALRVFSGQEGAGGDVIAAIMAAADRGCDAANLSLGIPAETIAGLPESVVQQYVAVYTAAVQYARSQGMVVVNSAGNAGLDLDPEETFTIPTEIDGVFGVSATGPIGFLWGDGPNMAHNALAPGHLEEPTTDPAFYTNYGESAIDISAAGGDLDQESDDENAARDLVLSTVNVVGDDGEVEAGYGWKAGTSMAAPQVSGAVALVRSLQPDASVEEVEDLLRETAVQQEAGEKYHGAGHLDLGALVDAAGGSGNSGNGNGAGNGGGPGNGRAN
ncbi:S8 family serine peptidase [Saliphagus sp. LR7]|uniref:S8 family peptidase n=1 Tax=Saliphagus sp. LR7 TaxID=2282654 RepID=UPI000DF7327A|nr:S8 family serine peptidase [Saliphagus sp. LR7]